MHPLAPARLGVVKERLYQLPVIGQALRIQDRFGEVNGTALANGIALQTFLSIFPLLIVAISVIGFLAADDPNFTDDLLENLSLTDDPNNPDEAADQLRTAIESAKDSRQAGSVVGLAGLAYSGLNLVTAVQRSVDVSWQTFGKGLRNKLKAVVWLLGAAVIFVATFAVTAVINFLPGILAPLSILVGFGVNVALFLWTFTALGRVPISWRDRLPGALTCAVGFEILKIVGSVYVPRLVANSSALYGSLGVVFAVLAWLAFFGRLVVYGSIVNVVTFERRHGTVSLPIQAPRIEAAIPVAVNRAGAVVDRLEPDDDEDD